jgi:hypothetical protein
MTSLESPVKCGSGSLDLRIVPAIVPARMKPKEIMAMAMGDKEHLEIERRQNL